MSWICCVVILISCVAPRVSAVEEELRSAHVLIDESVEYLEDGAMLITSVYEEEISSRSIFYNKSGRKVRTYVDNNGDVVWTFTVYGEFRILEGASVTCISASCSSEIFHEAWVCTRKTATPSGSWAIANGEFTKSLLGIVVDRESVQVTLTSDVYGNLS